MLLNPWINVLGAEPLARMQRLEREMNRLFTAEREPAVDVWTSNDEARVAVRLPGFAAEDVDVSLDGDVLTIQGNRAAQAPVEGERWHVRERGETEFTRALRLPFRAERDEVEARFDQGVLWIRLPRAHAERAKKITVKNPS
ncbi:MAG: Hsp20/alpha crystallin family protein [Planctomycetes bacterium]|nr:Hsp20/alpha crystallin family protein [Planctomycetota bacterium]